MKLYELAYICRLYPVLGDFEASLTEFRRRTRPALNIRSAHHRQALFEWLNAWGCRQFAKKHHAMAGRSLLAWGREYLARLPRPRVVVLLDLSDAALDVVTRAYGDLL